MMDIFRKPKDTIECAQRVGDVLQITTARSRMRIEPKAAGIFRIRYTRRDAFAEGTGIGIQTDTAFAGWTMEEAEDAVLLQTETTWLSISKTDAAIRYLRPDGTLLLAERENDPRELESFTSRKLQKDADIVTEEIQTADGVKLAVREASMIDDKELYHTRLHLQFQPDEHLFGLGQAEEGALDLRGTTQYVHQANRKIGIPFFLSTKGYGLLLATGGPAIFEDTQYGSYVFTEADREMDYYFIAGETFDEVIRGYRFLTGKAVLLPAWAYGYVQSQERYETQAEMLQVAEEYRRRGLGLDCLVLDWKSWEEGMWGQKTFDKSRFPDLQALTDSLHEKDIRMMVSIWPNMSSECDNYREFKAHDMLLPGADIYDAFNEDARRIYWKQAEAGIFRFGTDAWWCDASEPFSPEWEHKERIEPGQLYHEYVHDASQHVPAEVSCAYSLVHAQGIYEGQRGSGTPKRVINLTRSAFTGQQRYATILWSGDIEATWDTFRKQIAAGLNFCASGLPYWTLDIGAFFVNRSMPWFWMGDYPDGMDDLGYQELYTRWFQYGAFLPVFRAHGTDVRREMWAVTEPSFYAAMVRVNQLRYQLMPYIYSLAGAVYLNDDTMMRMLAFDFPQDPQACAVKDEFLLGRSLLVCPVTQPMYYSAGSQPIEAPKTREVYLPEGADWYDFYTNKRYAGGQTIQAEAGIDRIPLFVKAGSILPMTEAAGCVREALAGEITLKVYPGADASFTLYMDAQDGYDFENGAYTLTPLRWLEAEQRLVQGESITPAAWDGPAEKALKVEIIK